MDKAPDAFRTISEVADELDIPQHVLRFWESRFPQIKPMKRAGGRRYYRPEDVDLLRGIKHLLYAEGYTIRGAQGILRDKGQKFVQTVWQPGAAGADEIEPAVEPVDEAGEGASEEAPRSLFGLVRSAPRASDEADAATSQPSTPVPQLSRENVRRLQSALHELQECRQAIDQALKEQAA